MVFATDSLNALQLASAVRNRRTTAERAVQQSLDRIGARNAHLNALREVHAEQALRQARRIDKLLEAGEDPGALAGVPVAIKDNIVAEIGTSACGSRMLEGYQSPFTATAVRRLTNAGAIVIGRANCDEFAMGSSTEHCAFGPVRNPHDGSRVPGGSSGGSAAAVAAGLCPIALGSETGGSVRQPAALCGCVGVKPSYGRVSRHGLVAFGSSLDQIGPLARDVRDACLTLNVIAGVDRFDSTSTDTPVPDYLERIDEPVADLRIGVPREYLNEANDAEINEAVREAIGVYRSLGAAIVEVDLAMTPYGIATYYVLCTAEASSNLARFDGIRYGRRTDVEPGDNLECLYSKSRSEGFGPEVQRRIMLGTYVLSAGYDEAYYKRALQVRRLIKQDFDRVFNSCHALIGPTTSTVAFPIGEKADPLSMYLCDAYTVGANIAGTCALSIPCGWAQRDGYRLPIGLHIQCQAFDEMTMFRVARMYEANAPGTGSPK
jgi:aspartyl-tRNA(Asn)/glutamyl-tRNA(Gln) amidotransferase subunit A